MILQHFEIKEEHIGYSGRATIVDGERIVQVVFGHTDVIKLMDSVKYTLPAILRFDPSYNETFLPVSEMSDEQ